jgi:multiple sugar transport system permease protein
VFAAYPILFALGARLHALGSRDDANICRSRQHPAACNRHAFWRAVGNTFVFLSIHLPLQIATALALALALNRPLAFLSFWRAAFFLPVVISGAVVAIFWSNLYATMSD